MSTLFPAYESQGAYFDEDRIYRYALHRMWSARAQNVVGWDADIVLWVMLNQSTADEHVLDPTLRRCEGFSRAWGCDGFEVCNLFAYRSTDPDALWKQSLCGMDVVGPENDAHILKAASRADRIVLGWGAHSTALGRAEKVARMLLAESDHDELHCLGKNLDGSPRHPLYLPSSTKLQKFA